jgi:F0F1-type ATP synthase membrane subunit b/b'
VEDLRAEIRNARDQAQRQREELDEAHTKNLAATAEVLQAERTEHEQQYRQICSDTTAEMTRLLDTALEENNRTTDTKLAETGAAMAQQGQEVNNALAASNAHWRRLTTILIVATAATSAVALAALATALL